MADVRIPVTAHNRNTARTRAIRWATHARPNGLGLSVVSARVSRDPEDDRVWDVMVTVTEASILPLLATIRAARPRIAKAR